MNIILPANTRRQDGVALLITIMILLFGAVVLSTYLLLTENEFNSVGRSQVWNSSMTLTEAGVEDALGFMNKYDGNLGMVDQWSTDASAAQDGWTKDGNLFTMHRVVGTNTGYYDVTIDDTDSNAPVITCVGTAYWNLAAAKAPFMLAAAGVSVATSSTVTRSVQVKAVYSALFPDAIDSVTNINLNGNNVLVNSFDSSNPFYSDWTIWGYGTYDSYKARGHGNVATDSDIIGAISVGQANIYGKVNTGPGGTTTVGNNGYVGPWPQSGSGIQPGYSSDDMNVVFPDVTLPAGATGWQNVPSNNTITTSGNYYMSSLNGSLTINAPNVNIYVAGSISLSGQSAITIGTNATSVNMYVAGPSISTSGNATINNLTQHASVLGIYGLPTLTSISFGGNAAFTGTVYAPEAAFGFGGGGNNTYDFVGAVVVNYVQLNGHANFHYDESLARSGPGRGYIPTSWKELTSN